MIGPGVSSLAPLLCDLSIRNTEKSEVRYHHYSITNWWGHANVGGLSDHVAWVSRAV